jgi:hypothetical protein
MKQLKLLLGGGLSLVLLLAVAQITATTTHNRFPVTWLVGSGWDSINGSIPAPGWPYSSKFGWQCVHPGAFYPSPNVTELFGVENCTQVQCGPGCTNAPDKCQDWTQGLFPSLKGESCQQAQPVNGGVPQAANLSTHLAELRRTVPLFIPDPEWDGMAVFDFEKWTNVWELMISPAPPGAWHSICYQNYSIELERQAHPTWSEAQLVAAATVSYETAATEWLVQTLRTCRSIRPKAKWGLYGYPIEARYDVGNSSSAKWLPTPSASSRSSGSRAGCTLRCTCLLANAVVGGPFPG